MKLPSLQKAQKTVAYTRRETVNGKMNCNNVGHTGPSMKKGMRGASEGPRLNMLGTTLQFRVRVTA